MTDKMTPAHLRDLADAIDAPNAFAPGAEIASKLRQEAARREAEAKPDVSQPSGWVTARGHVPLVKCPGGENVCSGYDCLTAGCKNGERGKPQVEREGLDSADAELAHSLRSVVTVDHSWPPMALSIIRRYEMDRLAAKDRIEAQAREIAELKRDQIETERSLVFWEKRADVAEAKAARLVIQMERAKIMIGARLDAMGPALREAEVNAAWHVLNAALSEAGHADNGGERGR